MHLRSMNWQSSLDMKVDEIRDILRLTGDDN